MPRQDLGAEWISSIQDLAAAYGLDPDTMQQRVYALAEQIHRHYCFNSGPVNHREARPDEHIAAGILGALAGGDWWMLRGSERAAEEPVSYTEGCGYWLPVDGGSADSYPDQWWGCVIPDERHHGKDHVLAKFNRAEIEAAMAAQEAWDAEQEAKVDPAQG